MLNCGLNIVQTGGLKSGKHVLLRKMINEHFFFIHSTLKIKSFIIDFLSEIKSIYFVNFKKYNDISAWSLEQSSFRPLNKLFNLLEATDNP